MKRSLRRAAWLAAVVLAILPASTVPVSAQTESEAPASATETFAPPRMAGGFEAGGTQSARDRSGDRADPALQPPPDLNDLAAWLNYRLHNHIDALPNEARLFYRRGLLLHESGEYEEAVRLVHGAAELDPRYVAPHLTLASWFLMRNPSQALLQYAFVLDLTRRTFVMQLAMMANSIYLVLQALLLGLIVTGAFILILRQQQLRHAWQERLTRFLSPNTARWWSWGILILPFFLGFGPVLPTVVFLGMLWPMLKVRERTVFIGLALFLGTAPIVTGALDRLSIPLRTNGAPFHGVTTLETDMFDPGRHERLVSLAETHPDNGFIQFALGWMARRAGDLEQAETAWRRTLSLWPEDDRALTNLGNTLAMTGRADAALDAYRQAVDLNPSNAAAYFNMSQILTRQFEYRDATNALSRASALDFDMVKAYQTQQTDDGFLPLIDLWISPHAFWSAMPSPDVMATTAVSLPPVWRSRLEFSGWLFSGFALLATAGALAIGILQNRSIPLRRCSNCGTTVCRRCAKRRRELALCHHCASVEARAESPEFAKVLLAQHQRQVASTKQLVRTALSTLVPGYGLMAFRRVFGGLFVFMLAGALVTTWLGLAAPFPFESDLALPVSPIPLPLLVGCAVGLYAISLLGYFSLVAREKAQAAYLAAPSRSRASQTTRRETAAAA